MKSLRNTREVSTYIFQPNSFLILFDFVFEFSKDSEHYYGSSSMRPIIVVPASEYPGNICLKNAVRFLKDGRYEPANTI